MNRLKLGFTRLLKLFTDRRIWVRQISVSALAAATAWQVGDLLLKHGGLVAAIVASLSIRISLHKSVREGFGQIVGTAIGAGVALASVWLFHFGFLAVGATVLFCSVVARALHLGEVASVNVPVTALIVIGPGLSESTAFHRLISTLIGAGVAIVFSYFSHAKTPAGRAVDQISSLGLRSAQLLGDMSEGVAAGYDQEVAGSWLARARLLMEEIPAIRAQALEARSFAKWFPTAEADEAEELYMRGVAVEHTVVQVRTIARTLFDSAVDGGISRETKRQIALALSMASFAITAKAEQLKEDDQSYDDQELSNEIRSSAAALAETLIQEADSTDQEQLIRSISLITNIERIADSLDESSPALMDVDTPAEPAGQKVLKVSPLDQTRRLGSRVKRRLPKSLRKYF
ncbi:MAG: FUSC family protein [Actinomycetes bacterium]